MATGKATLTTNTIIGILEEFQECEGRIGEGRGMDGKATFSGGTMAKRQKKESSSLHPCA
jgi:hypothetical protein